MNLSGEMNKPQTTFIDFVKKLLNKGHERSVKAKKNILASLLIKGGSIAISLVLVPLTINYINPSRYGIWLTISSIVAWFSFFDIGLTQGLRNKFAEAKAKSEDDLAQIYVSTTFAILSIVFISIWLLFILINPILDWSKIINVSESYKTEISILAIIVFTYFCLTFILRVITTILTADQRPAMASLIDFLGQLFSLVLVGILVLTSKGSLIKLGLALCAAPLVVLVFASIILYQGDYRKYRPLLSKVKISHSKGLFNLGLVFFVIQIAAVIQFQTANLIIAQNFSTEDVTSYNIVYKYFGILNMLFIIFLTPFWSASTEAYMKSDIDWIRNGIKSYGKITILLILIGLFMLIFSETAYNLWLGEGKVIIPFALSLWGFVFFSATIYGAKYVYFLNSINALRIQFFASLLSPVLYIVVALGLIKFFTIGVHALFIASLVANFNAIILAPLQYHQVIVKGKKGLWIK